MEKNCAQQQLLLGFENSNVGSSIKGHSLHAIYKFSLIPTLVAQAKKKKMIILRLFHKFLLFYF